MINNSITNGGGLFYKIKDQNNTTKGYLYGTVHTIHVDRSTVQTDPTVRLHERVIKALHKSSALVTESTLLADKDNKPLKEHENMADEIISKMKKEIFLLPSRDKELIVIAYENNKELKYLESIEVHIKNNELLINDLTTNIMKNYSSANKDDSLLDSAELEFKNNFKIFNTYSGIIHKCRDEAIISTTTSLISPHVKLMVIDGRNANMAIKIDEFLLNSPTKFFIGIGVAHLINEEGVVNLLREKGWTVIPIDLPEQINVI